jgi:hypothetical protein
MKKIIKQKKIKYGVLSFYNHSTGNYKRKLHRIWYKLKEKCNIINISDVLPKFKILFEASISKNLSITMPMLTQVQIENRKKIFNIKKFFLAFNFTF